MRLNAIVLLATVILFASVDASSTKSKSIFAGSISADQHDISAQRFLRADKRAGNEERVISINQPSGVKRIKNLPKSGAAKLAFKAQLVLEWLKGKATGVAFTALKLNQAGDNLFSNPQFSTWVSYVAKINKKHPKAAIVATLVTRYGDEGLAKMLDAARKVEGTKNIATKLQVAQMKGWLRKEKSADDIFELLKLDTGVEKLLTSPNLNILSTYVSMINKRKPVKEATMIDTITIFYGDEAVSKMLEAAKKVPSMEKLAKELQVAHFNQWLKEGAKPAQIWKMLKMNKKTWMTNLYADIWRGYLAFYKAHMLRSNPYSI